mgnify:CR=1 FL=1
MSSNTEDIAALGDAARMRKLPRWAQVEIKRLRANAAQHKAQQEAIHHGTTDTFLVVLADDGRGMVNRGLPPHSCILYGAERNGIEGRYKDGTLRLNALHSQLSIHPVSSNCVEIKLV